MPSGALDALVNMRVNEPEDEWETLIQLRNEVVSNFRQGHFEAIMNYYRKYVSLPQLVLSLMDRYVTAAADEKQAFASVICFVLIQDILKGA